MGNEGFRVGFLEPKNARKTTVSKKKAINVEEMSVSKKSFFKVPSFFVFFWGGNTGFII